MIRNGRLPAAKDMSKTCASYTGSKVRTERKAKCLPSRLKTGSVSRNRSPVSSVISPVATSQSRMLLVSSVRSGTEKASQAESGDQLSPLTSP